MLAAAGTGILLTIAAVLFALSRALGRAAP
jgi:hypothetical protein